MLLLIVTIGMPPAIASRMIVRVFLALDMTMITDHHLLPVVLPVPSIPFPVYLAMPVRFGLIHHHLIPPVNIILPAPLR